MNGTCISRLAPAGGSSNTIPAMRHFVEWDVLDFRIDGSRLSEIASRMRVEPIERLEIRFANERIRVEGSIRKVVSIPFTLEVTELVPEGSFVAIPVRSAAAFGGIPIPRFLFGLVRDRLPKDQVTFRDPATFVVSLDRFLPKFLSAEIRKVWIIDGGLAVTLGRGGADIPPGLLEEP